MKKSALAFGLFLASFGFNAAHAQESRPLTLDQARELALEHNPAYRQAQNDVEAARAGELLSRSEFLPTLSASFNSGGSFSRRRSGEDNFGRPIEGTQVSEFTGSNSRQGLGLSWQLFDGGERYRNVLAARAGREAAIAGVADEAATMDAELTRRYYLAQHTAARIELEERLLEAAEASYAASQRLLRVAAVSPLDLLGAELDVTRQRQALEAAQGAARVAMLALAQQMGTGEADGWELVTDIPAIFDPSGLDPEALVTRAYEVSPRLREIALTATQAEHQRQAAGAARWPAISADASFGRSVGAEGYGALFEPNPFDHSFSFGIGLSLPLFSQYQTTQRVTQARVAARNAEESARATRLEIDRSVREALIQLGSEYRSVQLNDAASELARRRLDLANQQYRLGSLEFTELQQIVTSAATAERDALDARYAFADALATLEERVGGEIEN
jgi:outer membrane protein